MSRIVSLVLALAVVLGLFSGTRLHAADIPTMDSQQFAQAVKAEKGKILVVNFWATWCGPCRLEIPDLIKLRNDYPPSELTVLGVSLDYEPRAVSAYMAKAGINYPVALGSEDLMQALAIRAVPKLLVFDRQGTAVVNHDGVANPVELRRVIDGLKKK